ncbi:deoxyguanosinetriphosphate triphosphohydrolase family protein [Streptomyces sp. NPDC059426]|uniref:deoxyguanosinetriphosphate triphosphohydrolase family protein n=1 Tax=Streptomyces sp. NPDC059426 TaxID=3346827 RepID=UPI0036A50B58
MPTFHETRLTEKRSGRTGGPDPSGRTPFERDRDRILYSAPFRRLAGVTQVSAVREKHLLHNRLTHSLKVAQIGRRIAQRLVNQNEGAWDAGLDQENYKDFPDIVEAAGLAHDIGHPPFGHTVEDVLGNKMREFEGFEGNAQSFRVVTKLAVLDGVNWGGLDLTRATLNAILKYPRDLDQAKHEIRIDQKPAPWTDRRFGDKWGFYWSEKEHFDHARELRSGAYQDDADGQKRSAAATLMDWADDVSYAVHDLYDYFSSGLIPLHELRSTPDHVEFFEYVKNGIGVRYEDRYFSLDEFKRAYSDLLPCMPRRKWTGSYQDRHDLDHMIHALITDFNSAARPLGTSEIEVDIGSQYRAEVLKQLTHFYVIDRPGLRLVQEGQKEIIRQLFEVLMTIFAPSDSGAPPLLRDIYANMKAHEEREAYRRVNDEERRARAVCDYIFLLTEDQAINLFECLKGVGVSQGSIFGAWFG